MDPSPPPDVVYNGDAMRSPFPGMDPYLERHWPDVHQRLITYLCDEIEAGLPEGLVVRTEERVYVETEEGDVPRRIVPDVRVVTQDAPFPPRLRHTAGGIAVAEPMVIPLRNEPVTESFVNITDPTGQLITVIELLSPSNRLPGEGRDLYRQKQKEVLASDASLVEIDLVRSGRPVLMIPETSLPRAAGTTYCVCVKRGWDRLNARYYPLPLRERLPGIEIPLRRDDAPLVLDLQALVDHAYRKGRYYGLDYRQPCVPPLEGEDAAWADELLRAVRKR
jgi:hypothetical protein